MEGFNVLSSYKDWAKARIGLVIVTTKMDAHPATPESGLVREENMMFVRVMITHEMKPRMAEMPKPEVRKLIINLNMSHTQH